MMNQEQELKKEFLSQRAEFNQNEGIDESAFQERIRQYLATKTPEEAQMLADIMLECVNEDIEKTDNLIHEARLRKVLSKVYDAVSWSKNQYFRILSRISIIDLRLLFCSLLLEIATFHGLIAKK